MKDLIFGWLCVVASVGMCLWYTHGVVKEFGWRGPLVKVAVFIIGEFLAFPIGFHTTPLRAILSHATFVGNPAVCVICCVLWSYLLSEERPMRWMLKPVVECLLYSALALVIAGTYAEAKGWI